MPRKYTHASLVVDLANRANDLYISKNDAKVLHARKLLQKIEGQSAYCAPRNWRQICHGITPPLHRDVLDHAHLTPMDAVNAA